jgi:hypothetical protein
MATNCESECDCGAPGGYPHEPDCHSYDVCDEGHMCDLHEAQAMAEHAYLRGVPRYAVIEDAQGKEEFNQQLRDAGRGHLVKE